MSFNYKIIIKVIGLISLIIGLSMLLPLLVAYLYGEKTVFFAFLKSIAVSLTPGLLMLAYAKTDSSSLRIRDGYLIAGICWFTASAFGAFPYFFSAIIPNYLDAYFESVSGFTTTGASIIEDFSVMPKAIQFWRSFSHWLGAMGILILAISLLPALGIGGLRIASAEAPGPTVEKISTKISDSARKLYTIYISFTLIEVLLLMLGGMNLFDSLIHTFSSIGTGGLSNYKDGISHFDSFYLEFIIIFFSVVASINFALYNLLLKGKWRDFLKDAELRVFLSILAASSVLIALNLWLSETYDMGLSARHSLFQATAFMSTSGYAIADFTSWPSFSQMLLFSLMLVGGCSASTCGSIKVIRVMILFKLVVRGIYKQLHPNAVIPVKIGSRTISAETVSKVASFTILYFTIFIISSLLVSLEGHDLLTLFSATASSLSNTGL